MSAQFPPHNGQPYQRPPMGGYNPRGYQQGGTSKASSTARHRVDTSKTGSRANSRVATSRARSTDRHRATSSSAATSSRVTRVAAISKRGHSRSV